MTDPQGAAAGTVPDLLGNGRDDAPAIGAPGGRRRPSPSCATSPTARRQASTPSGSAGTTASPSCSRTAPPWRRPSWRSPRARPRLPSTRPIGPRSTISTWAISPKALVVERGSASPAIAVAARRGVPVVELVEDEAAGAGAFRLEATGPVAGTARLPGRAEPDDVALVLHTSGTTSRPKIVPLSHRNVCASARHVVATLSLQPDDVCLNVMPLFHIHGLIAAVLASLAAGGAVVCTPGFNALNFFGWLDEARPTWYTAVPTMPRRSLAGRTAIKIPSGVRACASSGPPRPRSHPR